MGAGTLQVHLQGAHGCVISDLLGFQLAKLALKALDCLLMDLANSKKSDETATCRLWVCELGVMCAMPGHANTHLYSRLRTKQG